MTGDVLTKAAMPFSRETSRVILAALIFLTLVMVVRLAWISDDALITVRCILNALHGYGPVFNIDERVQAFTHPLWFLCATLATRLMVSPWIALLVLSWPGRRQVCGCSSFVLAVRPARGWRRASCCCCRKRSWIIRPPGWKRR